jgi:2',3'-cyclic-nucleotide 2'-phosphodiesterase (5'-nucleotidase family)
MRHHLICYLLFITSWFSCSPRYVAVPSGTGYYEPGKPDTIIPDGEISAAVAPWKQQMDSAMNRVICTSGHAMEKGVPESELGNLVADACFEVFRRQYRPRDANTSIFCVLNNGGLRSSLPAGTILLRHIYELMPFENELVVVKLTGVSVMSLFDYIADRGGVPVSNLKMSLSDNLFQSVYIGGRPFVDSLEYEVLTSDYLAGGGDQMVIFKDATGYEKTGIKVRDAIIIYLTENGCTSKQKDGRITK